MFKLHAAGNLPEAYILLHLLEQAGIETRVLNEHAQGGLGDIPFTHAYPEVWVMQSADETRAREVLATYEKNRRTPTQNVACRACHELNPGSFDTCWHCGAQLL